MDNFEDLEYREERIESKQHQPIKKHIPLKLKSSNSQSSISVKLNSVLNKNLNTPKSVSSAPSIQQQTFDFNSDLIKTTIKEENKLTNDLNTDFSAKRTHAVEKLNWNLNSNSNCQKLTDQAMDFCMICNLPILIYGRLIPCKHVMCIQCANSIDIKVCLKESCNEIIEHIDTALRGGIFVCNYEIEIKNNIEKFRLNPDLSQKKQCGRSYMSQRDLLSHIQHRHESNSNQITYTM